MQRSDIENMFTYHAPTLEQTMKYNTINEAFKELALKLFGLLPQSAVAMRQLHLARMLVNSAVALHQPEDK